MVDSKQNIAIEAQQAERSEDIKSARTKSSKSKNDSNAISKNREKHLVCRQKAKRETETNIKKKRKEIRAKKAFEKAALTQSTQRKKVFIVPDERKKQN